MECDIYIWFHMNHLTQIYFREASSGFGCCCSQISQPNGSMETAQVTTSNPFFQIFLVFFLCPYFSLRSKGGQDLSLLQGLGSDGLDTDLGYDMDLHNLLFRVGLEVLAEHSELEMGLHFALSKGVKIGGQKVLKG